MPLNFPLFFRATESFVVVPFELVKIKYVAVDRLDFRNHPFLYIPFQAPRQVEHVCWADGRLKDNHQKRRRSRPLRWNGIHLLEAPLVERRILWIDLPSQGIVTQTNGVFP